MLAEFNRRTFAEAGVAPEKIRVVPQGIDASQFDPDNHPPLVLRDLLGTQLITGRQYDTPLVTTVTGAVAASQDGSSRTQAGDARQPYGKYNRTLQSCCTAYVVRVRCPTEVVMLFVDAVHVQGVSLHGERQFLMYVLCFRG